MAGMVGTTMINTIDNAQQVHSIQVIRYSQICLMCRRAQRESAHLDRPIERLLRERSPLALSDSARRAYLETARRCDAGSKYFQSVPRSALERCRNSWCHRNG